MNPFVYGRVVSLKDFCPRPQLQEQLESHLLSHRTILVEGERRVGKTSLICETVRKIKNHRLLYVDLMEIKDIDEFCRRFIKSVLTMEKSGSFFKSIIKSLIHLKPVFSIDPLTGSPTVTIGAESPLQPDSIESLLELIYRERGNKNMVVVFDEFQDILNLKDASNVLGIMRSRIQFQKEITYVFCGSIRNKMNAIFSDPESPFFKSAIVMSVGSIEKSVFSDFIRKKFNAGKRTLNEMFLERIFMVGQHNPGDIQQLCAALWDCSEEGCAIDESLLSKALYLIFSMEIKGYEACLSRISGQQQRCLSGLARLGGVAPLSSSFLRYTGISQPGSVKKALDRLVDMKIIYKIEKEYRFTNPFFKAWLMAENI